MQTVAAYECQAGICVWPIPFPFSRPEDVGASLIEPAGLERELAQGLDYVVQDSSVFFLGKPGYTLRLYLKGDPAAALAASSARTLAAQTRQAEPETASADTEITRKLDAILAASSQPQTANDAVAELASRLEKLEAEKAAGAAVQSLAEEQAASIAAAGQNACQKLDMKLDAAVDAITLAADEQACKLEKDTAAALAAAVYVQSQKDEAISAGSLVRTQTLEAVAEAEERLDTLDATIKATAKSAQTDLAANVETAQANLAASIAATEDRASQASLEAVRAIAAAKDRAVAEASAASRLAGQAWPETGWLKQDGDIAARSIISLPEPMRYWPGRNSLAVSRNGFVLIPGLDFEEVGTANALSNSIRILAPANTGDIWGFLTLPTNIAQDARDSAAAAATAAANAASASAHADQQLAAINAAANKSVTANAKHCEALAQSGQQSLANIRSARDSALAEINSRGEAVRRDCISVWQNANSELRKLWQDGDAALRSTWQKAEKAISSVRAEAQTAAENAAGQSSRFASLSKASADEAAKLAGCAWDAAFQASIDRSQPGIASVTSHEELARAISGIYIINPMVNSRSPFMGIYPVENLEAANYDGVFFIGPPYPDQPKLPDIPKPDPEPEPEPPAHAQAQNQWLPCGHTH